MISQLFLTGAMAGVSRPEEHKCTHLRNGHPQATVSMLEALPNDIGFGVASQQNRHKGQSLTCKNRVGLDQFLKILCRPSAFQGGPSRSDQQQQQACDSRWTLNKQPSSDCWSCQPELGSQPTATTSPNYPNMQEESTASA